MVQIVKLNSYQYSRYKTVYHNGGIPLNNVLINEHRIIIYYLECFMARIAAMKKVLSPSSETMMTETEAAKA